MPGTITTHADTVAAGESEYIWKEFCRDFEYGSPKPLYHETGTVALTDSPTPRFDLLKLERYSYVSLQFSRGCPFRCEFCDIIVMFGRKPRVKSLEQVGRELDELRRLKVHSVFFVDDNLIGNLPVAKKLLAFLKEYQDKHNYKFSSAPKPRSTWLSTRICCSCFATPTSAGCSSASNGPTPQA